MARYSSPTETTATFAETFGRDEDLPTALLISPTTDQGAAAAAVPLSPAYGFVVENAVVVPSREDLSSGFRFDDRSIVDLASHRGRVLAEEELDDIQRANTNVRVQNYFEKAAVNEANRLARNRIQLDNVNGMTSATSADSIMEAEKWKAKQLKERTQQSHVQGTFGKDYEVSTYDVSDYDTTDYDVSPYKSVYES